MGPHKIKIFKKKNVSQDTFELIYVYLIFDKNKCINGKRHLNKLTSFHTIEFRSAYVKSLLELKECKYIREPNKVKSL